MRVFDFKKLDEVLKFEFQIYAHTNKEKEKETLEEHKRLCQRYYLDLYRQKCLGNFFFRYAEGLLIHESLEGIQLFYEMIDNVITFHDTGKVNPNYQKVVMKNKLDQRYQVDWLSGTKHSLFSAFIYLNHYMTRIDQISASKELTRSLQGICLINGMVIARHHSDFHEMQSFINEFREGCMIEIMECGIKDTDLFIVDEIYKKRDKYPGRWDRFCKHQNRKQAIATFIYARFLYSVLVSCDYYATTEYMSGVSIKDFGNIHDKDYGYFKQSYEETDLIKQIRSSKYLNLAQVKNIDDINQLRTQIFKEAENNLYRYQDSPIYFFESPTGSGKSNTAYNLSFQLLEQGYQKIYYVYPFNTLVEQNLLNLKDIFGENSLEFDKITVLNSNTPIKQERIKNGGCEELAGDYMKALLDRQFLNYPFILTTHVTLFQTLFSSEREALFGFLQLKDSIIVLDEIQSYKNTIWSEIIIFLKQFAELLHMKIIIMSATLPQLNYLTKDDDPIAKLLPQSKAYFNHKLFRQRVNIRYHLLNQEISLELLKEHLIESNCMDKKIVFEFIMKKRAYEFLQLLQEDEQIKAKLILITGDDNRADQMKKIEEVKMCTGNMIVVATQVIEAGVDIDMDIGYKDISKLDSEEQFLGRINRSCKRAGIVYFFNLDDAAKVYTEGDFRMNQSLTLISPEMQNILEHKSFSIYYQLVMELLKSRRNDSRNSDNNLDDFFKTEVGYLNFSKISERMKLIDDNDWTMSVYLVCNIVVDGKKVDGKEVWNQYKQLLSDFRMEYSEKQVKLSIVRSKMNFFIYEIKKVNYLDYNEKIGELYRIDDGESYFTNGIFDRDKLEKGNIFY